MYEDRHYRSIALLAATLAVAAASNAQEPCRARLAISVDAEVPDARDPSFLSGLLANPQYRLAWVSSDTSAAVYDLSGPSNDPGCANMIDQIRKAAAVLDVRVLDPEPPLD